VGQKQAIRDAQKERKGNPMKKSLLSLVLALAMIVAFIPLATVSAAPATGTITVQAPTSLVLTAGDFIAFQLFTVERYGTSYDYKPIEPQMTSFLTAANVKWAGRYPTTSAAFWELLDTWGENPSAAGVQDKVIQLAKDIEDLDGFPRFYAAMDGPSNVKFSGLPFGYYLVAGKGQSYDPTKHDDPVYSLGMLCTVDSQNPDFTRKLKADAPSVEKFVDDSHPIDPANPDWKKETDRYIGDTINFKVVSRVPEMIGYTAYSFILHDSMSKGLSFNASSVSIKLIEPSPGTGVVTVPAADYTVSALRATTATGEYTGGQDFDITFTNILNYADKAGWTMEITYNATLNKDAVMAPTSNPNKVRLEYSNNPSSSTTTKTPESEVKVFTFDLIIYKYNNNRGKGLDFPLQGAEFELRKVSQTGTLVVFFDMGGGNYRVATPTDSPTTTTLVSPANGIIHIYGLDADKTPGSVYYLIETKPPLNFNPVGAKKITMIHKGAGLGGSPSNTVLQVDDVCGERVEIPNRSGSKLPETGGAGTKIFYIIGGVMAIGLGAFFVISRRRKVLNFKPRAQHAAMH